MDATGMAAAQRVANELRADGCNRDGGGTATGMAAAQRIHKTIIGL